VSQAREKEGELLDNHYRRDFISCDNQLLNGEMFLQVSFFALSNIFSVLLGVPVSHEFHFFINFLFFQSMGRY
jgi:hypothetical protein